MPPARTWSSRACRATVLSLPWLLAACATPTSGDNAQRPADALPDVRAPIDLQRLKPGRADTAEPTSPAAQAMRSVR